MSCASLQTIRKGCANPIAGIKKIEVRDYYSFAPLQVINSTIASESYDTIYEPGFYTNLSVYNETKGETTPLTADIQISIGGTVTSCSIWLDNPYYLFDVGDILTFPGLPIDVSGTDYNEMISTTGDAPVKFAFESGQFITKDTTEDEFGDEVSDLWYQIEFAKESGNFTSTTNEDLATGNIHYAHMVECVIPRYTNTANLNKLITGQRPLVMIIEDNMNSRWLIGLELPMTCTKIEKATGSKYSDSNMVKLTFEGQNFEPEVKIN